MNSGNNAILMPNTAQPTAKFDASTAWYGRSRIVSRSVAAGAASPSMGGGMRRSNNCTTER